MAHVPAWKRFETRVAKALGGRRIPVTGIDRHGSDVTTPLFEIQVKRRKGMPSYLREWLDGICLTAKCSDRIGIVVWTEPGKQDHTGAVVVVKYADWCALHGTPTTEEELDARGQPATIPPTGSTAASEGR